MNELIILDYIIERLSALDYNENDGLIAELRAARKAIACVPSYTTDKLVKALFDEKNNVEEDNAE